MKLAPHVAAATEQFLTSQAQHTVTRQHHATCMSDARQCISFCSTLEWQASPIYLHDLQAILLERPLELTERCLDAWSRLPAALLSPMQPPPLSSLLTILPSLCTPRTPCCCKTPAHQL